MPGDDVKIMQANLNKISKLALQPSTFPPLLKDGVFGPRTCRRVKEFQRLNRLRIDGIIGPKTKDMLARLAVRGTQRRPGGGSESNSYLDREYGYYEAASTSEMREKHHGREAEEETFPGPEEALVEAIRDEKGLALARAVYARRIRRKHA